MVNIDDDPFVLACNFKKAQCLNVAIIYANQSRCLRFKSQNKSMENSRKIYNFIMGND